MEPTRFIACPGLDGTPRLVAAHKILLVEPTPHGATLTLDFPLSDVHLYTTRDFAVIAEELSC